MEKRLTSIGHTTHPPFHSVEDTYMTPGTTYVIPPPPPLLAPRPGDSEHTQSRSPGGTSGILGQQVGGNHYRDMAIQPMTYILANNIGFCEGTAIAYLSRWKAKGGIQDLEKARQTIDFLIESEKAKPRGAPLGGALPGGVTIVRR